MNTEIAPGSPGISAKWTSSSKSGVGKALNANSNLAFTIGYGIINEVYYPREDIPCIRDMGLLYGWRGVFFRRKKGYDS